MRLRWPRMRRPNRRFAPAPSGWPTSTAPALAAVRRIERDAAGVRVVADARPRHPALGFSRRDSNRTTASSRMRDAGTRRQRRPGAGRAAPAARGLAHGALTPGPHRARRRRFGGAYRQRIRRGARVARMEPRKAVARIPRRAARGGQPAALRSARRRHATGRRRAGDCAAAAAPRRRVSALDDGPGDRSRPPTPQLRACPRFACGSSRRFSCTRVRCSRRRSRRSAALPRLPPRPGLRRSGAKICQRSSPEAAAAVC